MPPAELSMVRELAAFERLRLSRRPRTWIIRTAFALLLWAGLYLFFVTFSGEGSWLWPWDNHIDLTGGDMARLAEGFVMTFFGCHLLGILLITPTYLSGAISEDREHGTLDLLFTTHLNEEEIIQGKMRGRLIHLYAVVLSGIPILTLVMLWGGVGLPLIFIGYASTFLLLRFVAKLTMVHAIKARSPEEALLTTYLALPVVTIVGTIGAYPVTVVSLVLMAVMLFPQMLYRTMFGLDLLVFGAWLWLFVSLWVERDLRQATKWLRETLALSKPRTQVFTWETQGTRPAKKARRLRRLRIWNDALWWKEIEFDKFFSYPAQILCLALIGIFFLVIALEGFLFTGGVAFKLPLSDVAGFPFFFLWAMGVGFGTAGCVAWEKQQGTWLSLLSLPHARTKLLWIKLAAKLAQPVAILIVMGGLAGLGLATGYWPLASFLHWSSFATAHVVFLATAGLALSVYCPTRTHAWLGMVVVFLLTNFSPLFAPWVAWRAHKPGAPLWRPTFLDENYTSAVTLTYLLLAILCWFLSVRKLQREHGA